MAVYHKVTQASSEDSITISAQYIEYIGAFLSERTKKNEPPTSQPLDIMLSTLVRTPDHITKMSILESSLNAEHEWNLVHVQTATLSEPKFRRRYEG